MDDSDDADNVTVESQKIIVKCLKSLLNNHTVSSVLELYLERVCTVTDSKYGLIGQRIHGSDPHYRYFGMCGMPKSSSQYKKYVEDGYYDDKSHNMHIDFVNGKPIFHNDLRRSRNKPYPKGHPDINRVIFIPLRDIKGNIVGVLGLGGDNAYNLSFVDKYNYWIDLGSIFLQITLELVALIQSRDNFLANISHELRTPLSGIMCVNNIVLNMDLPPTLKHHMEIIETCCTQLLDLTNDILDYTNITSGKLQLKNEEVSILDVLDTLNILVKDKIQPGVKLQFVSDSNIPDKIMGDRTRIIQILMNVMDNSSKFTKTGHITVTSEHVQLIDDTHIIKFTVEDTGCGIDKDRMVHVFDMVNNFNPSYLSSQCGVGLGLPITKHIVELYGGVINISSEVNKGTTIDFILKLGKTEDIATLKKILSCKDILLYINNDIIRDTIFDFLLDVGARPQIATDKVSLKRYLKRHGTNYNFQHIVADTELMNNDIPVIHIDTHSGLTPEEIKNSLIQSLNTGMPTTVDTYSVARTIEQYTKAKRQQYKVMIAEDNEQNMEVFTMLLDSIGYNTDNITKITNGAELYVALIDPESVFDIAFIDLKMPVLDGISAVKQYNEYMEAHPDNIVTQRRNHMLILAVTASVSPQTKQNCFDVGMNGYIQKPIKVKDLEKVDVMINAMKTV